MGCVVVDKGDLGDADSRDARRARSEEEVHPRDRARLPEAVSAGLPVASRKARCRSCSAATTRSRPDRSARRRTSPPRSGGDIGLLWVDAHGDMNTPATTTSGNVHGMPLAALLGPEPAELSTIGARSPKVRADQHRAHRHPQPRRAGEAAHSRREGARLHDEGHRSRTASPSSWSARSRSPARTRAGIHVSFDLDVCDPAIAPGVGTPVKGGLDYREAHMVMEMIADSGRLIGARPGRDQSDPRHPESDRDPRHRAGAVGDGHADHLNMAATRRFSSCRLERRPRRKVLRHPRRRWAPSLHRHLDGGSRRAAFSSGRGR